MTFSSSEAESSKRGRAKIDVSFDSDVVEVFEEVDDVEAVVRCVGVTKQNGPVPLVLRITLSRLLAY